MKKLICFLIKYLTLLYRWIATDGLLHILMCIVLMLSLQPIIGYALSLLLTCFCCISKEHYDYYLQKDNSREQVEHDSICNIIGVTIASLIILIWYLL